MQKQPPHYTVKGNRAATALHYYPGKSAQSRGSTKTQPPYLDRFQHRRTPVLPRERCKMFAAVHHNQIQRLKCMLDATAILNERHVLRQCM